MTRAPSWRGSLESFVSLPETSGRENRLATRADWEAVGVLRIVRPRARVLKLQHRPQPFIHGVLQARWQRACMFGQKAAIESQQLGDVHNRIAGQAGRSRRQ